MTNFSWKGKHGPLLIAEIGGNHEGNFEYAKKLTQLAIESGADYVKFQIYTGDGLVNPIEGAARNQHFKKFELSPEQHIELARSCIDAGVGYLASVWIPEAIEWIDPYMDFYKIGSGDMTAYPVIKRTLETQKPLLVSTGLATEAEVLSVVNFIRSHNSLYNQSEMLALLQCTSMYPIPPQDANLLVMQQLKSLTGCTVGYSDHTEGMYALEIAVAMGAEILEFHFTDERQGKSFRDHKISLTKDEVQMLIKKIGEIEKLKGNSLKKPLDIEGEHVISFRRAVYPARDLPVDHIIQEEDLIVLRPNHGIPAESYERLIGMTTKKALKKYEKLSIDYFK